jgi:hypothetical protein
MNKTKWMIIGAIILVIAIILMFSIPSKKPDNTQEIVNAALATAQAQFDKQLASKDAIIKAKESLIKDKDSKLVISEAKYNAIVQKYLALQKEKEDVKPPTTGKELRDRFIAAGYAPLPEGQCGAGAICFDGQ